MYIQNGTLAMNRINGSYIFNKSDHGPTCTLCAGSQFISSHPSLRSVYAF